MRSSFDVLLLLLPALPLAAGLLVRSDAPRTAGRLTGGAAWAAAGLALAAGVRLLVLGPVTVRWAPFGTDAAFAFALRFDAVSAVMAALVAWLGVVVIGYSRRCLAGDPGQPRFLGGLSLTLGAVLTLALAGHLLLLLAAWIATSLCLHRLLLFYPDRAGARFAARKKFVFSRVGDGCLLGAALVLHAHHHTFDLGAILDAFASGRTGGAGVAAGLLACCAMLKSAQFPFHSWLPDTMDTPTPVSAFMHAGIVNAGGFLVVRMAPVFAAAPAASALLAIAGTLTAGFGALVMLAQPGVKRALAYSTIAQMGFMLLQGGLGAYGMSLLHIVAHSLYKAHAFLTAGSTVGAPSRAAVPLRTPTLALGVLSGGTAVLAAALAWQFLRPAADLPDGVFVLILALALAYGSARLWSAAGVGLRSLGLGFAAAVLIALVSLSLHAGAATAFAPLPHPPVPRVLLIAIGGAFGALFVFQVLLWRAGRSAWGRRLYVHALNGFYAGTWVNRLLGRLWPESAATT